MRDAVGVEILHAAEEAAGNLPRVLLGEALALADEGEEVAALRELGDDEDVLGAHEEIEESQDVRGVELGHAGHLAEGLVRELLRELLHGHGQLVFAPHRAPHDRHRPAPEDRGVGERHVVPRKKPHILGTRRGVLCLEILCVVKRVVRHEM